MTGTPLPADTVPVFDSGRWRPGGDLRRIADRALLPAAWVIGLCVATQAVYLYTVHGWLGRDSHAYWSTGTHWPHLYAVAPGSMDAFNYSPVFAQLIYPLTLLPWPVFCAAWMALEVAAFVWLLRPMGWRWAGALSLLCASEWTIGNVVPFIAVAAVLGLEKVRVRSFSMARSGIRLAPGWWAVVVLLKPTMALGPVWFVARGEWRRAGVAAAVTAGVVAVSLLAAPGAWVDWLSFLIASAGDQGEGRGLVLRTGVAVVLTVVAARTDRPWLLLVAMVVASPVWAGASSVTLLAGVPRLWAREKAAPSTDAEGGLREGIRSALAPSGRRRAGW